MTRYFGLSEGFFLRLQNADDPMEQRRRSGVTLTRIEPRAA
jgi:antitoxin HigA-1